MRIFLFCLILSTIFLVTSLVVNAQTGNTISGNEIATPPNAAGFIQYTKVPVGEFTGIPDIKVPLYTIKSDNLNFPLFLSYYARGVQPNTHSGWVGTGWNLIADGVITRKINDLPDEFASDYIGYNSPYGDNMHYGWYFGANHTQNYSISQYQGHAVSTGTTSGYVVVDTAPDEFSFSINGISGTFFLGSDGKWKVRSADGTTLRIQETVGSVTIRPLASSSSQFDYQTINPTFVQFTLTAGDGTRYIFGGNPSSGGSNTTIEFNRRGPSSESYNNNMTAMAWHVSEIDLPSGKKITFNYFRDGTVFTYAPSMSENYEVYGSIPGTSISVSGKGFNVDPLDFSMNAMDPVYLQTIVFPEGKVVFNAVPSNEVDYLEARNTTSIRDAGNGYAKNSPGIVNSYNIFHTYGDLANNTPYFPFNSQGNLGEMWYKLNSIQVYDNNNKNLKTFNLSYSSDANTRLFLSSVQENDLPAYTFTYNTTPLPAYCSIHTDHWGFYNGQKTLPAFTYDANNFVTTAFQDSYYQFREPDPAYVTAGILTKVTYPTGGYSQFFYEPNQYSKWVGFPVAVNTLPSAMTGAGVRVQKVVTTDNANLTPITYEYKYVNNLTDNVSSGVLGMPKPAYAVNDQVTYVRYDSNGNAVSLGSGVNFGFWSSNSINPSQNDDGNIVTYSNVIERQSNNGVFNGMKATVFTNHDNGYPNNNPDQIAFSLSGASQSYLFHNSNRTFERGRILTETSYDQNNKIIHQLQFTYNDDATRFDQCTKLILSSVQQEYIGNYANGPVGGPSYITFVNNSALRFFYYFPYLKKKVETFYPNDGSVNNTVTTTNYAYDAVNGTRNQVSQSTVDSKGYTTTSLTKFPLDYGTPSNPEDDFTKGIVNLQSKSAVSLPVESMVQLNDGSATTQTLSATLNSYHPTLPVANLVYKALISDPKAAFTPSTIAGSCCLVKDGTYEPRMVTDIFDNNGNTLLEHVVNGGYKAYQWGYSNTFPVAVLSNAPANTTTTINTTTSSTVAISSSGTRTATFTTSAAGTIVLNPVVSYPDNYNARYTLTGPVSSSGILCGNQAPYPNGTCSYPRSASINAPAGTYTLTVSLASGSAPDQAITYAYLQSATSVNTTKFYYDGFEEGDGNTFDAKTGHYAYNGQFNYTVTGLNNGNYVLSYWLKTSNGWSLTKSSVSVTANSYAISVNGQIDDVRLYPVGSLLATYTYDPLVGMTSQTDQKNMATYYEYDNLQRLTNIKDKDGNIIKNITYHYQGQAAPNYSGIAISNITGTAVSLGWSFTSDAPTASASLQYTDTSTQQVYTYNIPAGQTSTTLVVPAQNRSYNFVLVQNLSSGTQLTSAPLNVHVN
ncbi:hypothetical protein [Mucilaginibacter rubeus]|uniref:YD repeat-containing protein n=1 Tax=Mucilaginibacter rubeus TaxID=2027860 RepID=A0A5C1HWG9_9SPHI|nr:hypothetical protein [Mucilaginibacter rubeus]QEM09168.1 hypothetical protein DEO27_003755 [Mucilaginibacter rubeus]